MSRRRHDGRDRHRLGDSAWPPCGPHGHAARPRDPRDGPREPDPLANPGPRRGQQPAARAGGPRLLQPERRDVATRVRPLPGRRGGAGLRPRGRHGRRRVARRGGSLEDLWCFNDEGLARAVATCRVPVVSAIGHETDVTIVDFVADVRAPTPSAAAELVSPDAVELAARVNDAGHGLLREIREVLTAARGRVTGFGERMSPRALRRGVEANRALLGRTYMALAAVAPREVSRHRDRLDALGRRLDVLSPLATLQRGYAIAERDDGRVVARAAEVDSGDALAVRFQDGRIHVRVNHEKEAP